MSEIPKEKLNDIKVQMEYYLSDENLKKDSFFHQKISSDPEGYIDLDFFLKCNKIKNAGWTKEELKEGIKESSEIELDESTEKVRRKNNKELPELILLSKKRKKEEKKEEEEDEKEKENENNSNEPIILKVTTEEETKIKWKDILEEFQKSNLNLNVVYGRFKLKEGNFAVLLKKDEELKFNDSFKVNDIVFKVIKCEGEDLIEFWQNHGQHYQSCIKLHNKKAKKDKKNKKEKNNKKNENYLKNPINLGGEKYTDISLVRNHARKILNECKDGEALEGKNKEFIEDILKYHHNYDDKIKDLDFITTGKPEKFNYSRCFFIVKKNGDKIDFSIQKCIDQMFNQSNEKK